MKRTARPKGKKFFPVTFTLTQEQIEYLNKQPNASEIIRKILDDLIQAGKEVEIKLEVVSLRKQLEELQQRKASLRSERLDYILKNAYIRFDTQKYDVDWLGSPIKWDKEHPDVYVDNPVPQDNEDGRIGMKVVQGYNEAIATLEQRIIEVKQKILSM